jgi:hypothetical protein
MSNELSSACSMLPQPMPARIWRMNSGVPPTLAAALHRADKTGAAFHSHTGSLQPQRAELTAANR